MKKSYLGILVVLILLFAGTACGDQMSFGSVGHNQRVTMIPGEAREFKLSFFNNGNTPLVVEMGKEGSREIRTSINPRYFILENWKSVINPMGEEEWVVLGDNYAKAVPVYVTLKIPDNISEISRNYHVVKIIATATSEEGGPGGTREKISQAREYAYSITIPGNVNAETQEEYEETLEQYYQEIESNKSGTGTGGTWNIGVREKEEEESQERGRLPTGFFSLGEEEESDSLLYLIIIIVIFVLIYLAYRKLRR
ncbi:MAG: hypothetical protein JSV92_02585 [archaeon]|nr:MAG: hypothetical protein JSV92_02585 [archaeon]